LKQKYGVDAIIGAHSIPQSYYETHGSENLFKGMGKNNARCDR
jgi:hypothetical protein